MGDRVSSVYFRTTCKDCNRSESMRPNKTLARPPPPRQCHQAMENRKAHQPQHPHQHLPPHQKQKHPPFQAPLLVLPRLCTLKHRPCKPRHNPVTPLLLHTPYTQENRRLCPSQTRECPHLRLYQHTQCMRSQARAAAAAAAQARYSHRRKL